jgi:hypothetical protein
VREMRLRDSPSDTYANRAFIRVHTGCTLTVSTDGRVTYRLPCCDTPYTHTITLGWREALRIWWPNPNWVVVTIREPPVRIKPKTIQNVLWGLQYLAWSLWDRIVGVESSDKKQRR